MQPEAHLLLGLLPLIVFSIPTAVIANMLAREKERNVVLWTVLGAIPVVGWFTMWFFIGAANRRLERKLDELLKRLSA
jgi:hypothetical protein